MDEGYIKFSIELTDGLIPDYYLLLDLNEARGDLFKKGLIGQYENGISFGNVSIKAEDGQTFYISGTSTGDKKFLVQTDYCRVDSFDLESNTVYCTGKIKASSESMSHGMVYKSNSAVQCVLHIHNKKIFDYLIENNYPATSEKAAFGTPELAAEISELVASIDGPSAIFATKGHEEGVIAYGGDIDSALQLILTIYDKVK